MPLPNPADRSAALVTGASSGIGLALARALAERRHDLVLVARRRERLDEIADELRSSYGVRADPVVCDLSDAGARSDAVAAVNRLGLTVEVLINCAGFGMVGAFHRQPVEQVIAMLRTNLEAVVHLTGVYAPQMAGRGRGAVLIVSSIAGNAPMSGFAAYAATKAATTSFAEALHAELRPRGVTVTALTPGAVATEFAGVAAMESEFDRLPRALVATAEECARAGLSGLDRGRRVVVPKALVRFTSAPAAHLPHAVALPIWRRMLAKD